MIQHLIKLIWNRKGSHLLLIIEIWASFMVLFGVMSLVTFNLDNYRESLGFEYEQVWAIDLSRNQDTVQTAEKLAQVLQRIKAYPEVEKVSQMSSNSPFSLIEISAFESKIEGNFNRKMMVLLSIQFFPPFQPATFGGSKST